MTLGELILTTCGYNSVGVCDKNGTLLPINDEDYSNAELKRVIQYRDEEVLYNSLVIYDNGGDTPKIKMCVRLNMEVKNNDIQFTDAKVETEEDALTASQLVYKTIGQGYVFVKPDVINSYGELLPCGLKKFPVRIENLDGVICVGLIHNSIHKGLETVKHLFLTDYKELWWLKVDKSM